jgi:hypothetical protein
MRGLALERDPGAVPVQSAVRRRERLLRLPRSPQPGDLERHLADHGQRLLIAPVRRGADPSGRQLSWLRPAPGFSAPETGRRS